MIVVQPRHIRVITLRARVEDEERIASTREWIIEVLRAAAPTIARRAADDDPRDDGAGKKSALKARWSRVREEVYVRLVDPDAPLPKLRGDRQAQVVSILASRVEVSMRELRSQLKNPRAAVEALVQRGLVVLEAREVPDDPFFGAPVPRDEPPPLRPAQDSLIIDTSHLDIEGVLGVMLHHINVHGGTQSLRSA